MTNVIRFVPTDVPAPLSSDPRDLSSYILRRTSYNGDRTIIYWHDHFYRWMGPKYRQLDKGEINSTVWQELEGVFIRKRTKDGETTVPLVLNRRDVGDVVECLTSMVRMVSDVEIPCWKDGLNPFGSGQVLSCKNGLLHIKTRQLIPHTPAYICDQALACDFDPNAKCMRWTEKGLKKWFRSDPNQALVLQECFGYTFLPHNKHKSIAFVQGESDSGKSQISFVLTNLIGINDVVAASIQSMANPFGLETWIGKRAAIFNDARSSSSRNIDIPAALSNLLGATGGDLMNVNKKGLRMVSTWLRLHPWYFTNELTFIPDFSEALRNRICAIILDNWVKGEDMDRNFAERVVEDELSGVLNWALDGLERFLKNDGFTKTKSGAKAIEKISDSTKPYARFVRQNVVADINGSVYSRDVAGAYKKWCEDEGVKFSGTSWVGRTINAQFGDNIEFVDKGGWQDHYKGIRLRLITEGGYPGMIQTTMTEEDQAKVDRDQAEIIRLEAEGYFSDDKALDAWIDDSNNTTFIETFDNGTFPPPPTFIAKSPKQLKADAQRAQLERRSRLEEERRTWIR